jgi:hypothetical protein
MYDNPLGTEQVHARKTINFTGLTPCSSSGIKMIEYSFPVCFQFVKDIGNDLVIPRAHPRGGAAGLQPHPKPPKTEI